MNEKTRRIDTSLVIDAIRKRWAYLLLAMLIAPSMALVGRHFIKPKLKASAQILVQESVKVNPVLKDMMVEMSVNNRLPEINSIVRSRQTLERVLRQLGEVTDGMSQDEIAGRVASFRNQIDVFGEGGGLIRITVVGRWAVRVYDGLKLLTDALIEEMSRPQRQALDETVKFLQVQLERVKTELTTIEHDLRDFKEKHASDLPEVHKLSLAAHEKLANALMEAETEFAGALGRAKVAEERLARYNPATAKIAAKLARARSTLRALQGTYTAATPQVQMAQGTVNGLEAELRKAREQAKAGAKPDPTDLDALGKSDVDVESQLGATDGAADLVVKANDPMTTEILSYRAAVTETEALRGKVDLLRKRVQESTEEMKSFATNEQLLNELVRNQAAKTKVYANLLERSEDAHVTRSLVGYESANQIRIVEEAQRPTIAPEYAIPIVAIGGLLGGLLFGLSLVVAFEFFDKTVRTPKEVEALTGVPVLGTLPAYSRKAA